MVIGKPNVQSRSLAVAVVDDNVLLECDISGYPQPVVNWLKNGSPIRITPWMSILANGSLIIRMSRKSDAGMYMCIAHNKFGTDNATVELIVEGKLPVRLSLNFLSFVNEFIFFN